MHKLIFLLFLFATSKIYAQVPSTELITLGMELEFTHPKMQLPMWGLNGQEPIAALDLAAHIENKCASAGCRIQIIKNGKWGDEYRVILKDGWWFQISYDPWCVEILTKPATLAELTSRKEILQKMIFESAFEVGLQVDTLKGAGHFNYGFLSAYGKDSELFLRDFVDLAKNPQLGMGIFRSTNLVNAPPVAVLPLEQRLALKQIVDEYNQGQKMPIHQLVKRIIREVYSTSPNQPPGEWSNSAHHQFLGMQKTARIINKDKPIGYRGVRSQRNIDDFLTMAEYKIFRLNYIKAQKIIGSPIEYDPGLESAKQSYSNLELIEFFRKHVQEMGGNWSRMRTLMSEHLQSLEYKPIHSCAYLF